MSDHDEDAKLAWAAGDGYGAMVLMIERGMRRAGFDVSRRDVEVAILKQLAAFRREVGKRPDVRARIVDEMADVPEDEWDEFVERRVFEIARSEVNAVDVAVAAGIQLTGLDVVELLRDDE